MAKEIDDRDLLNLINDKTAQIWVNGEEIAEAISYDLEVSEEIEEIDTFGLHGAVSKGTKCSGKYKILRRYSRSLKQEIENMKNGRLTYFDLTVKVENNDGKEERIVVTDCWMTKHDLAGIEKGKGKQEKEIPFGFVIDNVGVESVIEE